MDEEIMNGNQPMDPEEAEVEDVEKASDSQKEQMKQRAEARAKAHAKDLEGK